MPLTIVIPPPDYEDGLGPPAGMEPGQITFAGRDLVRSNQMAEATLDVQARGARLSEMTVEMSVDRARVSEAVRTPDGAHGTAQGDRGRFDDAAAAAGESVGFRIGYEATHEPPAEPDGEDWRLARFTLDARELKNPVTATFRVKVVP